MLTNISNKLKKQKSRKKETGRKPGQRHKPNFSEEKGSANSNELVLIKGAALWATVATSYSNCHR